MLPGAVPPLIGCDIISEDSNLSELTKRLVSKRDLPKFEAVELTLDMLMREGERLEYEQEMVNQHNLASEYLNFGKERTCPILPAYYRGG